MGKARVVEIFLASKLIYVSKFYSIPKHVRIAVQQDICDFVNFPHKVNTIAQNEMFKTKVRGGIKLLNVELKSRVPKIKWLLELFTKKQLRMNLKIFETLLGCQKGQISGRDLLFLQRTYMQYQLQTESKFYKEALLGLSRYDTLKGIKTLTDWDKEHIFYNPLLLDNTGKTFRSTKYFENLNVHTIDQLLDEKVKQGQNKEYDEKIVSLFDRIVTCTPVKKDSIELINQERIPFEQITEKILYEEALAHSLTMHHSQVKWLSIWVNTPIKWEEVWQSVHSSRSSNKVVTIIWEQIHLNFYTQFSYNKWHKTRDRCPLCQQIPTSIFHIILHCNTVNRLWEDIEPTLTRLYNRPISEEEKAFGITEMNSSKGVVLRNWLTYLMRYVISVVEKQAYYTPVSFEKIKRKMYNTMVTEITLNKMRYEKENRLSSYNDIITYGSVVCYQNEHGDYNIINPFFSDQ